MAGAVGSTVKNQGFLHIFIPFSSFQPSALNCQCSVMDDTFQKEAKWFVLNMASQTWSWTKYGINETTKAHFEFKQPCITC